MAGTCVREKLRRSGDALRGCHMHALRQSFPWVPLKIQAAARQLEVVLGNSKRNIVGRDILDLPSFPLCKLLQTKLKGCGTTQKFRAYLIVNHTLSHLRLDKHDKCDKEFGHHNFFAQGKPTCQTYLKLGVAKCD